MLGDTRKPTRTPTDGRWETYRRPGVDGQAVVQLLEVVVLHAVPQSHGPRYRERCEGKRRYRSAPENWLSIPAILLPEKPVRVTAPIPKYGIYKVHDKSRRCIFERQISVSEVTV